MVKILEARGWTLRLEPDPTGWCQVILQTGGRSVELGADKTDVIEERLAAGLADSLVGPVAGSIHGRPVRWVMSLAERHATVYADDRAGVRILSIQDAEGTLLGTFELSAAERQAWLRTIGRPSNLAVSTE